MYIYIVYIYIHPRQLSVNHGTSSPPLTHTLTRNVLTSDGFYLYFFFFIFVTKPPENCSSFVSVTRKSMKKENKKQRGKTARRRPSTVVENGDGARLWKFENARRWLSATFSRWLIIFPTYCFPPRYVRAHRVPGTTRPSGFHSTIAPVNPVQLFYERLPCTLERRLEIKKRYLKRRKNVDPERDRETDVEVEGGGRWRERARG